MSYEAISSDEGEKDTENASSIEHEAKTELGLHSPIVQNLVNPYRKYGQKYKKVMPQTVNRSFNNLSINDIPEDASADDTKFFSDINDIMEFLIDFNESSDNESASDDDGKYHTMFGGDKAPINLNLSGDEKSGSDFDENDPGVDKNDPGIDKNYPDVDENDLDDENDPVDENDPGVDEKFPFFDENDSDNDENYSDKIKEFLDDKNFLSECQNIIDSPEKINEKLKSYFDELIEISENFLSDDSENEIKSLSDEEFKNCCRTLFGNPNDEFVNQDKDDIASGVSSENDEVPLTVEPDCNFDDFIDSDESDLEFYENSLKKHCHISFDSKEDQKKPTNASQAQCDCWFCQKSWIEKFEKDKRREKYHMQHLCSLESTEIKGEKTIENLLNQHFTSIGKTIEKRGFFHLISCSGSDHKDYNTGLDKDVNLDSDIKDCDSDSNLKDNQSSSNLKNSKSSSNIKDSDMVSKLENCDMNPNFFKNYELQYGFIPRNEDELEKDAPIDKDLSSDQEACSSFEAKNYGESGKKTEVNKDTSDKNASANNDSNSHQEDSNLKDSNSGSILKDSDMVSNQEDCDMNPNMYNIDEFFDILLKDKNIDKLEKDHSNSDQEAHSWNDDIDFGEFIEEEINEKDTSDKDATCCGESNRNKWIPKNLEKALHLENCKCKLKHTEDELNDVVMDTDEEDNDICLNYAQESQSPSLLQLLFMGKSPLCISKLKKERERREEKLF